MSSVPHAFCASRIARFLILPTNRDARDVNKIKKIHYDQYFILMPPAGRSKNLNFASKPPNHKYKTANQKTLHQDKKKPKQNAKTQP